MNERHEHALAEAICRLAAAIERQAGETNDKNTKAILERIAKSEHNIMEAITAFAGRVTAAFDKLGTAVDGVSDDVAFLKEEIAKLQNSPGTLTPEDQATLDGLQARADALSDKVDALDKATERPPAPTP